MNLGKPTVITHEKISEVMIWTFHLQGMMLEPSRSFFQGCTQQNDANRALG